MKIKKIISVGSITLSIFFVPFLMVSMKTNLRNQNSNSDRKKDKFYVLDNLNLEEYKLLSLNLKKLFKISKYKWSGRSSILRYNYPSDINLQKIYEFFSEEDIRSYPDFHKDMQYFIENNKNKILKFEYKKMYKDAYKKNVLASPLIHSQDVIFPKTKLKVRRIATGFKIQSAKWKELNKKINARPTYWEKWHNGYNLHFLYSAEKHPRKANDYFYISKDGYLNSREYKAGNPLMSILDWNHLLEARVLEINFNLKSLSSSYKTFHEKPYDFRETNFRKIQMTKITSKSVFINGVKLDKNNKIFTKLHPQTVSDENMYYTTGLEIVCDSYGNIVKLLPYLSFYPNSGYLSHLNSLLPRTYDYTRTNLFPEKFNFRFRFLRGFARFITSFANQTFKLPNGYKIEDAWAKIDDNNAITNQTHILPPLGMQRKPYEYSPIRHLTEYEYNFLPRLLKGKAKLL